MKKAFLVLACVSFLAVTATSCKKNCVCKEKESKEVIFDYGTTLNKSQCDLLNIGDVVCEME